MMLAAPELVVAEPVELLDEVEIAAELQHRMLADRVMRGEEGAEIQTRHRGSPRSNDGEGYSSPSTIRTRRERSSVGRISPARRHRRQRTLRFRRRWSGTNLTLG